MVVLGIDPGCAIVGYGAVEHIKGQMRALGHGAITTPAWPPFGSRLAEIERDMDSHLNSLSPDAVAMEELFFTNNITTGIQVAQARGVLLLCCARRDIQVFEYTPSQVKLAVVGYGKADKKQVMEMTRMLLKLDKLPRPDDAADALAVAICHANTAQSIVSQDRKSVV